MKRRLAAYRRLTVKTIATALRLIAARLDPPTMPYGEWDYATQQIVIKIPNGAGGSMPLARLDIGTGQIEDRRFPS